MSRIIFLNGTSSSGKSTIAEALQRELRNPEWILMSVDTFLGMLPEHAFREKGRFKAWFPSFVSSFHRTVGVFARSGIPVIVDHLFQEREWLEDYRAATAGVRTVYVGLFCALDVLEERERRRGNRKLGLARMQYERVHREVEYDLRLETDRLGQEACVQTIRRCLESGQLGAGFEAG